MADSGPRAILALKFPRNAEPRCACAGRTCPRHYLAFTGFMLAGFLLLHFLLNMLALWPSRFQAVIHYNHSLGPLLPLPEILLIFLPLAIHVAFGVRTLKRERLRFGVGKHHHGSDLRQWLQRLTGAILLLFLAFHIAAMHRWLGGRFQPGSAFESASQAVWQFWRGTPTASFPNLLFAQFYLLGIAAAAYHAANGVATGAEVLGWVRTSNAQSWSRRASFCAAAFLLFAGLVAWWALAPK